MTVDLGMKKASGVSLREITADTVRAICNLKVSKEQEQFVASNSVSIAQAYFSDEAWFRAIYANDKPVGFVMLYDDPKNGTYFLWRLMIDAGYQGRGYGRHALELLVDYVKTRPNAKELRTSHAKGDGNPGGFYKKVGFEYTGEKEDNELVMRLEL